MFTQTRKDFRKELAPRLKRIADMTDSEATLTRWLVDFWTETEDVPEPMVRVMLARLLEAFGIKMELDGNAGTYHITDERMQIYQPPADCMTCGHRNIMDVGCACCAAELDAFRKEGIL